MPVTTFLQRFGQGLKLGFRNPALPPCHFQASHLEALTFFKGANVTTGVVERVAGSRV